MSAIYPLVDVDQIVSRLQATGTPFVRVGKLGSGDKALDSSGTFPAAYAVRLSEVGQSPGTGVRGGRSALNRVEIMIGVSAYGDTLANGLTDKLDPLRKWAMSQLQGWVPTPAPGEDQQPQAMAWVSGRRFAISASVIWWADLYQCLVFY